MSASLVLASASAARRRMLQNAGLEFTVDPAKVDEAALKAALIAQKMPVETAAVELAASKAQDVTPRHRDALVIGADQMLDCGGQWFDKPADRAAARQQLTALSGRAHRLISGVAIVENGTEIWRHAAAATIRMRILSDGFIDRYLDRMGDQALATVGAYELEGLGAQLFERVEGDYFTVLGLPLLPLLGFLRQRGAIVS